MLKFYVETCGVQESNKDVFFFVEFMNSIFSILNTFIESRLPKR